MHRPTCIFWANLTAFSLQRAPAKAAIFGVAPAGSTKVTLTVSDASGVEASYTVAAALSAGASAAGGTSNPLCQARSPRR
jgi:hypothetical protein